MTFSKTLVIAGSTAIVLMSPSAGKAVEVFDNGMVLAVVKYFGSLPFLSHSLKAEVIFWQMATSWLTLFS